MQTEEYAQVNARNALWAIMFLEVCVREDRIQSGPLISLPGDGHPGLK